MSIWVVPAVVLVAGLVPVVIFALRVAEEAGNLRRQVGELGQLRPALAEVRTAGAALRASMREMRET